MTTDRPTAVAPGEVTGIPSMLPRYQPEGTERQVFEVAGMCTCSGCPPKLYQALKGVEGVEHAAIDPVTGLAEVFVKANTDPQVMIAALTFEDYSARLLED